MSHIPLTVKITKATVLGPTPARYPGGTHFIVGIERRKGLRLGPILSEALQSARRAGVRPKSFDMVPSDDGFVTLRWLFAAEDEARNFADAMVLWAC